MALNTRNFLMSTEQPVPRVPVVIKERFIPGRTAMAGITLIAVMAIVIVIFKVAGCAGRLHLVLKGILGMAIATRQLGMAVEQLKFRIAGMIEARVVPVFGRVTTRAVVTAAPIMGIVF